MGIFSKKDYVCEKCGRTFQKRINLNGNLCDECLTKELNERRELERTIKGYTKYASDVLYKTYTADDMRNILDRREMILEKYRNKNGISSVELQRASDNYKNLTDSQAADVLTRLSRSTITATLGAAYGGVANFSFRQDMRA